MKIIIEYVAGGTGGYIVHLIRNDVREATWFSSLRDATAIADRCDVKPVHMVKQTIALPI